MNHKLFIFLVLIGNIIQAQNISDNYIVTYTGNYTLSDTQKEPYKEYFKLYVKGNESMFLSLIALKQDSILNQLNEKSGLDTRLPRTNHDYSIYINKDEVLFHSNVALSFYNYKETLMHSWNISNEEKYIKEIPVRKATVDYGGRSWTAWYAPSIPISAGPYKFKGLPGLILELTDSENHYHFTLYSLTNENIALQKARIHSFGIENCKEISREQFNLLHREFKENIGMQKQNTLGSGIKISGLNDKTMRDTKKNKRTFYPIEY